MCMLNSNIITMPLHNRADSATMPHSNSAHIFHVGSDHSLATTTGAGTDSDSNSVKYETTVLVLASKDGSQPAAAFERSLSHDLQIPSKSHRLTSGFNYPPILSAYGISRKDWSQVTKEITESSKLSFSQWRTVIGVGVGTMAIGVMILGIFGFIPAVLTAKQKRINEEIRNLTKAMCSSQSSSSYQRQGTVQKGKDMEESGRSLLYKIDEWNEAFFNLRGIMIRVDMPYDLSMVKHDEDVAQQSPRFPVLSIFKKYEHSQTDKYEAIQRVRIVIIPLHHKHEQE